MIYPGARSSIRLERLTEGIQFFEKVRILKEEFEEKGNKGAIKNIDKTLKMFDESSMDKISPTTAVNKAKKLSTDTRKRENTFITYIYRTTHMYVIKVLQTKSRTELTCGK